MELTLGFSGPRSVPRDVYRNQTAITSEFDVFSSSLTSQPFSHSAIQPFSHSADEPAETRIEVPEHPKNFTRRSQKSERSKSATSADVTEKTETIETRQELYGP
jgi:hypothetical protein